MQATLRQGEDSQRRARPVVLRTTIAGLALEQYQRAGGELRPVLERFKLDASALTEREVAMPLGRYYEFLDWCEAALGDPCFGLNVAKAMPMGRLGVFDLCIRIAPTLREAARRLTRYMPLVNEHLCATFREGPERSAVVLWMEDQPECLGRHGNEFATGSLVLRAREASGRPLTPLCVRLAHAAPADPRPLEDFFGCPLHFGCDVNIVEMRNSDVDRRQGSHDPELMRILDETAEQALARVQGDRVRNVVRELVLRGAPTVARTAAMLGLSARTLQRKLGEDGQTFRQLVEDARRDIALTGLREGKSPAELTEALSYADQASFTRAFRRWTGHCPGEYRLRFGRDGEQGVA